MHKRLLTILFVVAFSTYVAAECRHPRKVAVVLSGGGAKGMAHIGALKVLEKAGIPIDIITGTSMGAIFGGLYSVGLRSNELDSIVKKQNWKYLLSDREDPYFQSLDERRKQHTYFLIKKKTFSHDNAIGRKGGLIQGKNIVRLFEEYTSNYPDSMSFSDLPIPFACVATNIVNDTEYDFYSGVLSEAMRSSMAIPAVFTPVRKDDMVLVDGGLKNNFPVDLARKMGADYVIGITVQSPLKSADELKTSGDVIGQIIDINCQNKFEENLSLADVVIRVNTKGFSAASFTSEAVDTLIERGYQAAMEQWDKLMALKEKSVENGDSSNKTLKTVFPVKAPSLFSRSLKAKHNTLQTALGVRFDTEEIVALQMNGEFQPKEKPWKFDATLRLGKRLMLKLSTAYLGERQSLWNLSYEFRHSDINEYEKGKRVFGVIYNYHSVNMKLFNLNIRNFNVVLGASWNYYNYDNILISKKVNEKYFVLPDEDYFKYYVRCDYDSENHWLFPSKGARFTTGYSYITDDLAHYKKKEGISVIDAMWRMSFGLTPRLTFQPMFYGRMLFSSDFLYSEQNYIGGNLFTHYFSQQMPFAGVGYFEQVDNKFVGCQLKLQQRIADNNYVSLRLQGALHADKLDDLFERRMLFGVEASYDYNSLFGPLGGSLGYSTQTHKPYFYLNLGFYF